MNKYSAFIQILCEGFLDSDLFAVRSGKGTYMAVTLDAKGNVTSEGKRIAELPEKGDKIPAGRGDFSIRSGQGTHMPTKIVKHGDRYKIVDDKGLTLGEFTRWPENAQKLPPGWDK